MRGSEGEQGCGFQRQSCEGGLWDGLAIILECRVGARSQELKLGHDLTIMMQLPDPQGLRESLMACGCVRG